MERACAAAGIVREHDHNGMHTPISVSKDGKYSIEFVECLASCGTAPVCMVQDELVENVNPNSVADLLTKEGRFPNRPLSANGGLETAAPWKNPPHPLQHPLLFKHLRRADWTP